MAPELLHYEIEQRVASGGAGELFAARDLRTERRVTLRAFNPERPIDLERFERDSAILEKLDHPGIVVPYALEKDRDSHYLAMQEVDGTSLAFNIPDQGMALDRLVDLGFQLADAVAAAHQEGVLHRDLKPTNVLINHEGRIRILGFGLTQPMEVEIDEDKDQEDTAAITEVSSVSGMVPYMSPERLRGVLGDHRSDIFSIGVMLYQMATGRRPFQGSSSVEIVVSIVKDEPRPISQKRPDLPPELSAIIERCLNKEPSRRFQTTSELVEALFSLLERRKPQTADIPISDLLTKTLSPRRWWSRATVAAGLAATTLAVLHWLGPGSNAVESDRRLVAVLPFETLGRAEDANFALGMTEEIVSRLGSVEELGIIARSSTEGFLDSDMSPARIGRELGADFVLTGAVSWQSSPGEKTVQVTPRLIRASDAVVIWSSPYERVLEDLFSVQNEIAVHVIDQLKITLFPSQRQALAARPTQNVEAYQAYLAGQEKSTYTDDFQAQLKAVELLQRAVDIDPHFVEGWSQLAWTHAQIYHFGFDRSDQRRQDAEAAIENALQLDQSSPEARLAKANVVYWTLRDYRGALRELALARRRAPNDSRMIEAEGFILRRLGHMDDALQKLSQASRLDPLDGALQREIGTTLWLMRRNQEALPYFDQAIKRTENPLHPYLYKARALWALDRMEEAGRTLEQAPDQDSQLAVWFRVWHLLYLEDFNSALEEVRSTGDAFFQWTTRSHPFSLLEARVLRWMGREAEARPLFEEALGMLDDRLEAAGEDPRLMAARGLALAGLDRREEALRSARAACELLPLEADILAGGSLREQLAATLVMVGANDEAIGEVELLLSIPSELSVAMLEKDPRWQPLSGEKRFRALIAGSDRRHPR